MGQTNAPNAAVVGGGGGGSGGGIGGGGGSGGAVGGASVWERGRTPLVASEAMVAIADSATAATLEIAVEISRVVCKMYGYP